jgi:hypothetical protein
MYGWMATGLRPIIAINGMTDTTPGRLTRARRGSVRVTKGNSSTTAIGRGTTARSRMTISGIETSGIAITTAIRTTIIGDKSGDTFPERADHIGSRDLVWSGPAPPRGAQGSRAGQGITSSSLSPNLDETLTSVPVFTNR